MKIRKCKKKDCWNRTYGTNPLCEAHQLELELKAMQVLKQQKKQENEDIVL